MNTKSCIVTENINIPDFNNENVINSNLSESENLAVKSGHNENEEYVDLGSEGNSIVNLRRSTRIRKPPNKLNL